MWNKLFNWISRVSDRLSLEIKILGITVGFIVVLGTGVTFEMRNIVGSLMLEELDKQGYSMASDLSARSAELVLTDNLFSLHRLLNDTIVNNENVFYVFILNHNNEVIAHTFKDLFPVELIQVHGFYNNGQYPNKVILDIDSNYIHDYAMPIIDGKVGVVRVGMTESNVIDSVTKVTLTIMQTTLLMSFIGILAAYLLVHFLYRPIHSLLEATNKFSKGDFTQRVPIHSNDEISTLGKAFNELGDALQIKESVNTQLLNELKKKENVRKTLLKKVITAQEMERKRISRELHDEAGQLLSSLMVYLRYIKDASNQRDFENDIEQMRQVIMKTIDEVKRISRQLRPSVLDDLGLVSAIKRLIQEYKEATSLDIDFIVHGNMSEQRLLAENEIAIYRVLQEALTNVFKYAKADNISVIFNFREDTLHIIIEDDGIGFDSSNYLANQLSDKHLGLYGMKERTELIGGSLKVESQRGIGTAIYVTIPLVYEKLGG